MLVLQINDAFKTTFHVLEISSKGCFKPKTSIKILHFVLTILVHITLFPVKLTSSFILKKLKNINYDRHNRVMRHTNCDLFDKNMCGVIKALVKQDYLN